MDLELTRDVESCTVRGRPPWYSEANPKNKLKPLLVGIAGGPTSGKGLLCEKIVKTLGRQWVVMLSDDAFYRTPPDGVAEEDYNWDHPEAFDFDAMLETLSRLQAGKDVTIKPGPKGEGRSAHYYGADIVLMRGALVFYDRRVLDLFDIRVFVDCDSDTMLIRRLRRDVFTRGFGYKEVLQRYERYVKPAYEDYVLPTRRKSHLTIPAGAENTVAVDLLTQHMRTLLVARDMWRPATKEVPGALPARNLHTLRDSPSLEAMLTVLRNRDAGAEDFVFYTERVSRLVVELALNCLPDADCARRPGETPLLADPDESRSSAATVVTPTGAVYRGVSLSYQTVCAVSIIRAGEAMESAVRNVICDITIGKLLIQSVDKAPRLFYCKLDPVETHKHVLLLDASLATGQTARMAVRVLLDHGVAEENIYFLTLVAAPQGIEALLGAYPAMHIIAGTVDEGLDDKGYISPGIGNYGDRFFLS
mmetsp:Transcript_9826/g.27606  ORF Transcript_9826/g.27606 Transcript_9826/m.27606 type:complete len:476 (-) Transcript_9826:20-1447(-)